MALLFMDIVKTLFVLSLLQPSNSPPVPRRGLNQWKLADNRQSLGEASLSQESTRLARRKSEGKSISKQICEAENMVSTQLIDLVI